MSGLEFAAVPPEEFGRWWDLSVRDYAKDHVDAGNWTEGEALAKSEAQFRELLPNGVSTPGHFLYALEVPGSREHVGLVWFEADRGPGSKHPTSVFIFDLLVYEPFRGRGYGAAAMRLVEARARELGFDSISLHVFGHNRVALALYQKLGYEATNVLMTKKLGPPGSPLR